MKKLLLSLLALTMSVMFAVTVAGCGAFDTTKHYTVNFQYNIGDGAYDYSVVCNEGDEITAPYDKAVMNDYLVLWTINGNDVGFPFTVNSDCTLVGNAYKYDNANDVTFLGGLVEYDVLFSYIQTNWTKRTLGNLNFDDEDLTYYYIKYGASVEYNEIYFYPSTRLFKWQKTKLSNLTLGQVINTYQYTTQISATFGDTMNKASFKGVYSCESIDMRTLNVRDSVSVAFTYQINKIVLPIFLQDFRDVKYSYSMSNPYDKFDDKAFAKDLYTLMQGSMQYFQNQLSKVGDNYFVFF